MRLSQLVHKIPDSVIIGTMFIGTVLLIVYLISSINSFKSEISDLKGIIELLRKEQRDVITTGIREEFYLQELKGNVYYNDPYYVVR